MNVHETKSYFNLKKFGVCANRFNVLIFRHKKISLLFHGISPFSLSSEFQKQFKYPSESSLMDFPKTMSNSIFFLFKDHFFAYAFSPTKTLD